MLLLVLLLLLLLLLRLLQPQDDHHTQEGLFTIVSYCFLQHLVAGYHVTINARVIAAQH